MKKIPFKPLLLGIAVIFIFLLVKKFFVVTEVTCVTDTGTCPQEFVEISNSLVGSSLISPKSQDELSNLYSKSVYFKSLQTEYEFPSKLIINLDLRKPIGAIAVDIQGQDAMLIADDGIVLGPVKDLNYPLLIDGKFIKDSKSVSSNLVLASKILYQVNTLVKSKVWGNLDGEIVTATFAGGPKILINISSDFDNWYFPLQQIIERSKISSNKQPVKIDLRFTNPVLTY